MLDKVCLHLCHHVNGWGVFLVILIFFGMFSYLPLIIMFRLLTERYLTFRPNLLFSIVIITVIYILDHVMTLLLKYN